MGQGHDCLKTGPTRNPNERRRLDERIGLMSPVERSHVSLAQFRTETKYASFLG
jgi:hypothetical protein